MDNVNKLQTLDLSVEKKRFSQIGFSYFLIAAISILLQLGISILLKRLVPDYTKSSLLVYAANLLPMYLIAIPIGYFLLRRLSTQRPEKHKLGVGTFFIYLIICISVMYLGNIVGSVLTAVIGLISGKTIANNVLDLVMGSNIYLNLIFVAILAPMIEELLFRKILIDRVYKYGEGVAVVTSGLMFGLFHGNFSQFFYAFGIGMVFAYIYCKTGKLRYTIGLHMIINTIGSVVAPLLLKNLNMDILQSLGKGTLSNSQNNAALLQALPGIIVFMVYALVMFLTALAGIILFIVFRKRIAFAKGTASLPKGKRASTMWLNVGMILFTAACLTMFVFSIIE